MGRRGCGCCGCDLKTLHPPTDWAGWTNPPDDTVAGTIESGHTTSIANPVTADNWKAVINIADANDSIGTTIDCGVTECSLITIDSATWLRVRTPKRCLFKEVTTDTFSITIEQALRSGELTVLVTTSLGALHNIIHYLTTDVRAETSAETTPAGDWLQIEAGSTDIDFGDITVIETRDDAAPCPARVPALAWVPVYRSEYIRAVVASIPDMTFTFDYTGPIFSGSTEVKASCNVTSTVTLAASSMNGTLSWVQEDVADGVVGLKPSELAAMSCDYRYGYSRPFMTWPNFGTPTDSVCVGESMNALPNSAKPAATIPGGTVTIPRIVASYAPVASQFQTGVFDHLYVKGIANVSLAPDASIYDDDPIKIYGENNYWATGVYSRLSTYVDSFPTSESFSGTINGTAFTFDVTRTSLGTFTVDTEWENVLA